jgi:hypothetical protein
MTDDERFPLGKPMQVAVANATNEWGRVESDLRVSKLDIEGARRCVFDEGQSQFTRAVAALVLAAYQRGREVG